MVRQVSPGIHLITTAPSLTKCRRCHRQVLAATVGGLDRHVDTATLNDAGELAALLSGLATYALVAEDYLSRRSVVAISAGPPKRPVLADHACRVIPEHHIAHEWTAAAKALLTVTLGATVDAIDNDSIPF